jgi:hypothetical protein
MEYTLMSQVLLHEDIGQDGVEQMMNHRSTPQVTHPKYHVSYMSHSTSNRTCQVMSFAHDSSSLLCAHNGGVQSVPTLTAQYNKSSANK